MISQDINERVYINHNWYERKKTDVHKAKVAVSETAGEILSKHRQRKKKNLSHWKRFLICPTKAENREGRDFNLKDLRNLSKSTLTSRGTWKRQKKTGKENTAVWLKKMWGRKDSKRAYKLVKDLTTVKKGEATTVQDRSGNCLTEEREILKR